ncbi:putative late blight resistance protein homolog R1B-16 [Salvia splendens]|uniref:putative late blight resistance protein homolog R1B-16 n=1 Tax=Salvia splendens TaxID=180675 RepID=UPI001C26A7F1|nr:putative late blight resistance protein homolog R1B-16 [Salvia splendens]
MAATAHASLVSLLNTMDQIQTHPRLSIYFDNYQFKSLREMVYFLVDFVENFSEFEDMMRRIGDAAHEAEDIIEVEAADRIRGESTAKSLTMLLHLQRIIQDISSIKDEVIKFKDKTGFINSMPPSSSSSPPRVTKKTTMLGFDRYVAKLLDELTGHDCCRRMLPIVGMGGIGKTTLARNVYEHSVMVHHFDVRAWVVVSQEYNASDMLSQALSCLGQLPKNKPDDQLGEDLYKTLSGRRYLVILDDVWSVEAWEKIQFFFPQNDNGSRIVVTTRQQELVNYFGCSSVAVGFLDEENSWKLLCDVTFAGQGCPPQLEKIMEEIVMKCKGLPLAIRVIGGLLGKSPRTQEYWEKIAKDKSLVMEYSGDGSKPSSILYMSYKHLPVWLRSCFLYLGLFPEDHEIDVSNLIKLWVAEGFVKPTKSQSLEQVAEGYIKELIDRNLLLVAELEINKKVSYCCLHDLIRELCIRIAEKENFYCDQRDIAGRRHFISDERTRSVYCRESWTSLEKPSVMTPLILSREKREAPLKSRLLRVLVADHESRLDPSFQQVNVRYISLNSYTFGIPIPWSISLCWSLQSLILEQWTRVVVPSDIWKMPQLRHIEINLMVVENPTPGDVFVLHNLQTLKLVKDLIFTEEVCARIPNIRELGTVYGFDKQVGVRRDKFHLQNFGRLNTLESLQYSFLGEGYVSDRFENLKLPSSLRKLVLNNSYMVWSDMATIALLPNLQILRLEQHAVVGAEWNFVNEEFRSLKHLIIFNCDDMSNWIAEKSNFPVLETLDLWNLNKLDKVPWDIGEIPTLERICVRYCTKSTSMSAMEILEEQENLGNQVLQLGIEFKGDPMWVEKIKERFTSQSLHISSKGFYHSLSYNLLTHSR